MARRGKIKSKRNREEIKRPVRYRKYQQFFLIVCEDEKTEPTYFQSFVDLFPEYTLYLKTVGTGNDPLGVVNASISERDQLKEASNREIDFVWAVFDKDDADENATKIARFEQAFKTATNENINIAYSNEVFELWLLLHLKDIDHSVAIPRSELYVQLEVAIKEIDNSFIYEHGNATVLDRIKELGNEGQAILRATELLLFHKTNRPIQANPSTKVHLLVQELRAWIDYYNWQPE